MTLGLGTLDVRKKHLDVPIAAEATLSRRLADMEGGWVTVVSFPDGTIESRKLSKDWYDAWRLILDLLLLDEAAVTANAVDGGNLGAGSELFVQPSWHAFFPSMRSEFRFLYASASAMLGSRDNLHRDARSCWEA